MEQDRICTKGREMSAKQKQLLNQSKKTDFEKINKRIFGTRIFRFCTAHSYKNSTLHLNGYGTWKEMVPLKALDIIMTHDTKWNHCSWLKDTAFKQEKHRPLWSLVNINVTESECLKGTGHLVESSIFKLQIGSQIFVLPCLVYVDVSKFKKFTENQDFPAPLPALPPVLLR